MSTPPLISVTQCVIQAMDLVARLDAIGHRDDREATLATLRRAEEEYAELVKCRNALSDPVGQTAALDYMLDNLRARLKFFAKRL